MHLTLKTGLGIASSLGGVCAVSVPIALYSRGEREKSTGTIGSQISSSAESTSSQGKEIVGEGVSIIKCQASENVGSLFVNFGISKEGEFCWKINGPEEQQQNPATESLTKMLSKAWKTSGEEWVLESEQPWQVNCNTTGKGWSLDQLERGKFLGYCGSDLKSVEESSFLEISQKESREKVIKVCLRDCWSILAPQASSKLTIKKEDQWRDVEFYKLIGKW